VLGEPTRLEEMSRETMEACLEVFRQGSFTTLDITGGAPELHPDYRWFVEKGAHVLAQKRLVARGDRPTAKIITRTNLVILTEEGFDDLPAFWARQGIEVVASLPSWEQRNYDRQRGEGFFERALKGLRMLNACGYGRSEDKTDATDTIADGDAAGLKARSTTASNATQALTLNIVVNPGGAFLPPSQASAEREFREHLAEQDLYFSHLLTITNNPTGRFAAFLKERGKLDAYLRRLEDAFNPATVPAMMCRSQISVRWDGRLYDCDFNQAAELPLKDQGRIATIASLAAKLANGGIKTRRLRLDNHCYACCAGAGSSCGGTTA
jgi:MoaA/NifB/PqqE/SkfB family radical SAM enzyme